MKNVHLFLCLLAILFSCNNSYDTKQNNSTFDLLTPDTIVFLHKNTANKYKINFREIRDTIVTLDYLLNKSNGIPNIEYFRKFNYPTLEIKNSSERVITFSNDKIDFTIKTIPFDSKKVQKNIKSDSSYYLKHPFYGLDEKNLVNLSRYPKTELDRIILKIDNQTILISPTEYENFFDVSIECSENYCPITVYEINNEEYVLVMENSVGVGAYYAIFVFDNKGSLKDKIIKRFL